MTSGAHDQWGAFMVAVSFPTLSAMFSPHWHFQVSLPCPLSFLGDPNAGPEPSLASRLRWGQTAQKGGAGEPMLSPSIVPTSRQGSSCPVPSGWGGAPGWVLKRLRPP